MYTSIFRDHIDKDEMISLYHDKENTFSHLTGFVREFNDEELLIYHVTPFGNYDGYILMRLKDIYRIDREGKYEKSIKKLYKLKKQCHLIINCNNDELLFSLLDFSKINSFVVTFELNGNTISGFVISYDDTNVYVNAVDPYGNIDSETIINIDDVNMLLVDTEEEQKLKLLNGVENSPLSQTE